MVTHQRIRLALIVLCLIAYPREAEAPPLLGYDASLREASGWGFPPSHVPDGAGRTIAESFSLPPELCLATDL